MICISFNKRKQFGIILTTLLIIAIYILIVIYSANWLSRGIFILILTTIFYCLIISVKRLFKKESRLIISDKGIDFKDGYRTFSIDWKNIDKLQVPHPKRSVDILVFEKINVSYHYPFFTKNTMKNQIAIRTYDLESNHETIENHLFSYFKKHKKRYVRDKIIGKKIYQHIITDTEKQFEKSSL